MPGRQPIRESFAAAGVQHWRLRASAHVDLKFEICQIVDKMRPLNIALQAYSVGDSERVQTLAANEIAAHAALQPPAAPAECDRLAKLLGSFSPRAGPDAGEQVLERFAETSRELSESLVPLVSQDQHCGLRRGGSAGFQAAPFRTAAGMQTRCYAKPVSTVLT